MCKYYECDDAVAIPDNHQYIIVFCLMWYSIMHGTVMFYTVIKVLHVHALDFSPFHWYGRFIAPNRK